MPTPHDSLFKRAFSEPVHAEGELKSILPRELVAAIDWPGLTLCPGSFVDQELAECHADLLYRVRLAGREVLVYVLLEHKSWSDPCTPLQLLRYMLRIWEQEARGQTGEPRLTPILPVVVTHGEKPWPGGADFAHLFDLGGLPPSVASALRAFIPDFRFVLDDLTGVEPGEIEQRALSAFARLVLLCLRNLGRGGDPEREIARLAGAIRAVLRSPSGAGEFEAVGRHMILVINWPPAAIARVLGAEVGPDAEEAMTTIGELMIREAAKEAAKEAYAKGTAEGQRKVLLRQLVARFGALPAALEGRIHEASSADLESFAERVLSAATLEDVFQRA